MKDRTDTTGLAWMGLTLGCAECHGHKYDPVAHASTTSSRLLQPDRQRRQSLPGGKSAVATLKGGAGPRGSTLAATSSGPGPRSCRVRRLSSAAKAPGPSADRLDLARWLVDPSHPLTARVAVNRFWMHLFGTGIVPTPENFGVNGAKPTHPELLDWLAGEFVRRGWSRKEMIRLIVRSATYRQGSAVRAGAPADNQLLARQNRFRVEAEVVRDVALAASGLLSPTVGGPSIVPPFPDGLLEQKFTNEALKMPGADRHRRGLYIHVQRTLPHPLSPFDGADAAGLRAHRVSRLFRRGLAQRSVFVDAPGPWGVSEPGRVGRRAIRPGLTSAWGGCR